MKKGYLSSIFLLVLLILFLPLISAKTYYNQSGGDNTAYQLGEGIFNANLEDYNIHTVTLSDGKNIPLVSDLDGDGVNEIIAIDDTSVRLFEMVGSQLSALVSYDLVTDTMLSNMIIFDIDDDSKREIILASGQPLETLHIIEYNGTDIFNQTSMDASSLILTDPMYIIGCCRPNVCLMVTPKDITPTGNSDFKSMVFNSTHIHTAVSVDTSDSTEAWCPPFIRHISCADYDSDGIEEFIFTMMKFDRNNLEQLDIFYYDITDNGTLTEEQRITKTDCGGDNLNPFTSGSQPQCSSSNTALFTPPLVYDIETEVSGLETVVGMNIDENEYKMCSYKASGTELDDYPEVYEAEGVLISNVLVGNVWTDVGDDFCVMGYEDDNQEITLLCANERDAGVVESREFRMSTEELYNVSAVTTQTWNIITHSAQHSTITQSRSGNTGNLHELVTSYGILEIRWDDVYEIQIFPPFDNVYTLNRIWNNPNEDGVLLSIDAGQLDVEGGSEDLIFMTNSNLYYYDDGRVNEPAYISAYTVNPCLDYTWKLNTSVGVTVTATDPDNNDVSARVILYNNDDNEQDGGWKGNFSSGTEISFDPDFIANKTIGGAKLLLQAYDTEHMDIIDEIELTFSVGADGVEYGDCVTSETVEPPEEVITPCEIDDDCDEDEICVNGVCRGIDEECSSDADCQDGFVCVQSSDGTYTCQAENLIKRSIVELDSFFNMGTLLMWLFVMVVINIAVIVYGGKYLKQIEGKYIFAILVFINAILILAGVLFAVVPFWVLLLLILMGTGATVLYITHRFQGTEGV